MTKLFVSNPITHCLEFLAMACYHSSSLVLLCDWSIFLEPGNPNDDVMSRLARQSFCWAQHALSLVLTVKCAGGLQVLADYKMREYCTSRIYDELFTKDNATKRQKAMLVLESLFQQPGDKPQVWSTEFNSLLSYQVTIFLFYNCILAFPLAFIASSCCQLLFKVTLL